MGVPFWGVRGVRCLGAFFNLSIHRGEFETLSVTIGMTSGTKGSFHIVRDFALKLS